MVLRYFLLLFNIIILFDIGLSQNTPVVQGEIICYEPHWAILSHYGKKRTDTDSVYLQIGKNQINLKGIKGSEYDEESYTLTFKKKKIAQIQLLLMNDTVELTIDQKENLYFPSFNVARFVKGAPATIELYNMYNNEIKFFRNKSKRFKQKLDSFLYYYPKSPQIEAIEDSMEMVKEQTRSYYTEVVLTSAYSSIAYEAFFSLSNGGYDLEPLEWLADTLEERFPKSIYIKETVDGFRYQIKVQNDVLKKGEAPEFTLPDSNNSSLSFAGLKGNYVLIDFWASWCAPCIKKMPKILEFHRKYSNYNFKLVTISIDKNKQLWLDAIKKHNMENIINLHDTEGDVAKKYNATFVPLTVLIDPKGQIIGADYSLNDLTAKLESLFNKKDE